jgi:folate-binding protein YgfZ
MLLASGVAAFAGRHGLALAGPEAWDRHRLALGVPDGSADLVPQKAILLESGFDELGGVSFAKGCFVGQELTARTKHRGLVKKRLLPVAVEGPLPEPGTVVELPDGREAGELRTGLDGRALALLRLEWAVPAARGEVELRAGGSRLRPELPGWLVLPGGG